MAIDILIQGDYKDRDIKRAQRDLDLLGKQSGVTGSAFSKMSAIGVGMGAAVGAAAIAAAAAGAQMALEFGVNGVKAFIADDAAAARLAKTLQNLGLEGATAAVEANIDSLQRAAGVSDDVLRPAFSRLVTSTGNVAEANKLLALAVDISAGTGRDLNSVVMGLARAADGSTAGLSRLGTGLSKATLATGDMDVITKQLADTFGGQAAVKASTFQGQLDRISVAFGELQESFGRGFMAGVVSGFEDGRDAGDQLADTIKTLEPTFYDLGVQIGGVVQYIPQFVSGIKVIINGMTVIRESTYLAVKGLIAASQAMSGNFSEAAKTLTDGVDRVKVSFGAMLEAGANVAGLTFNPLRVALSQSVKEAERAGVALGGGGGGGGGGGDSLAGGATVAAEKTVVLTERQKSLALTMAGTQVAVKQATDELEALTKASDDYAASTTAAIQGTVSLSTAFADALKASEAGTLASGQTVAGATIANLQAQIDATKAFEASLQAIYAAGGSLALIEELRKTALEQGMPAGTLLATEVLTGGFVPALTAQLKDFNVFAGAAGTAMADNFFAQGITDANALLNGLSTEVAAQQKMLDRLGRNIGLPVAAAISEEIAQAIRDGVADGRAVAARRRAEAFAAASFVPITVAPGTTGPTASFTGGGMVNIPGLAVGGPATAGRPYIVGERGPELFVPGSSGSVVPNNAMGGNTYQITVQAGVGDPRAIGQQIVEYVKKFEQANGPVFRAA